MSDFSVQGGLFGEEADERTIVPGQWRLARLEVVNWGTFHGFHAIDIARAGYLLTGHSGSGKSSLVDAIAAVLTPPGKTHFNAAAADGARGGNDRSTLSYVRGAWSRAADEETGEITTRFLRPGASWSGILLRYEDGGRSKPVTLVRLFHVGKGATRPVDVTTVHLLTSDEISLPQFEDVTRNGLDARRIKSAFANVTVERKHSTFVAKVIRRLGVAGSSALVLLHRTQSAKNLGSLDGLFREYMLDEPDTFDLADRAVDQFTDLQQAHAAVVTAREQIETLAPLVEQAAVYDVAGQRAERIGILVEHLEAFARRWRIDLARTESDRLGLEAEQAAERTARAEAAHREADLTVEAAKEQVNSAGGQHVIELEREVEAATERVEAAQYLRADLAASLSAVGLDTPESASDLAELRQAAQVMMAGREQARADADRALTEVVGERAGLRAEEQQITREVKALAKSGSNIGADLNAARDLIVQATGLRAAELPFAGQLIEVRDEFADWTGAIERVLAPLATVMLVPEQHLPAVRAAANATNLGTRLRFEDVPEGWDAGTQRPAKDTVAGRVTFADHPLASWLRGRVVDRFAFACVEREADLRHHEKGVTIEGLVKRSTRSYEKNDRFAVHDQSRWVLGFSNDAKIELLQGQLRLIRTRLDRATRKTDQLNREREAAAARLAALSRLDQVEWERIDVAGRQRALAAAISRQDEVLAASGDLRRARQLLEDAKATMNAADLEVRAAILAQSDTENRLRAIDAVIAELSAAPAVDVPDDVETELREAFGEHQTERRVTQDRVDGLATKVRHNLATENESVKDARATAARRIERIHVQFRSTWPALAGDLSADVADRAGYLEILATLENDGLPHHERRFFEMLTTQSRQNIGVLATTIRGAPRQIRERIDPINESLLRSEFDAGRYLDIRVELARPPAAEQFLRDLSHITETLTGDLPDRSELEARFATLNEIMTSLRRGGTAADMTWRNQVLDTRRHVRFIAREVTDRGEVLNVHDSSAGLSGGQKQKLVVFCLAAALRYQLAPEGTDLPVYGSIVMDEAFDKADAAFTTMAMNIFVEFGFHMILATPLKLLRTLEPFIGGIALVTCRDSKSSSVASIADVRELVGGSQ